MTTLAGELHILNAASGTDVVSAVSIGAGAQSTPVLADGKVKPLAAVDGTHALNVTGLYGIAAEDAAKGEDAVVYLTGEFFAEGLALPDGVTAADIEVALRNIGIFLK